MITYKIDLIKLKMTLITLKMAAFAAPATERGRRNCVKVKLQV